MESKIVRDANGSVNVDASVEAYRSALVQWVEMEERARVAYREAVLGVLNVASGKRFALPSLVGMAMVALQVQPSEYESTSKAVESWIKANTGKPGSNSLFCAQKGKGGGYGLNPGPETNSSDSDSDSETETELEGD